MVFSAADGVPIHAQLFLPAKPASARSPAVIFFHGGSRRQMLLGWHYGLYYHNAYALNQYLTFRHWVDAYTAAAEFLERKLKSRQETGDRSKERGTSIRLSAVSFQPSVRARFDKQAGLKSRPD